VAISRWSRAQLQDGGWIRRMFMEGERLRAAYGEETVADLSIGQPLEAPQSVVEAFAAASRERFVGRFGYMPNLGYPDVRERAAEDVDFPGISSDSIAMTPGAAAAIAIAIRTFVDPGDDVIGVAPYFPEFRLYCETASARFVPVPTGPDLRLDLDAISGALSAHTAAVIVNSPCNPSGHVLDGGELSGLAALLEAHNNKHDRKVLLIVDEVYRRLIYSKDLGVAGERIGYLVLHPSLVSADTHRGLAQALRALGFVNAPATAQRALLHLESWEINTTPYRERRDIVMDRVRADGLDAFEPQGGLYLWLHSPWPDTLRLIDALTERRVLLTPGVAFGVPSHIRLCFSVPRPKLKMAMDALGDLATAGQPPE
jgi:aspartate aminotransferase